MHPEYVIGEKRNVVLNPNTPRFGYSAVNSKYVKNGPRTT